MSKKQLTCPITDVTVSRRPKRATPAAVLGVLLTNSRLGIRGGYSHGHRLFLHARPLDASLKWDFCCYFVNIIYQIALAAVAKDSQFGSP